ncbi:MAG: hypothetical protein J7604_03045 [Sporocytophaga sp.]|uniref:hypothetical protein n=1 Tax=Sporocytophaga sp. TaxID=2231183 RepID=UPI001B07FC87|nr:hypothetical protein [Sporocytophaga sp.]MBO9699156.1 hypothetical protein [Sporocytophaga sp.]
MNPKNQYFFSSVLKLLFLTGLLVVIAIPFFLWTITYNDFLHSIVLRYNIQDKEFALRNKYLTSVTFIIFRYFTLLVALVYSLLFPKLLRKSNSLSGLITANAFRFAALVKKEFSHLKREEVIAFSLITLLSLLLKLWYFFKIPFLVDEAFSYVYFVSKGFPVTASYYPAPNNHILSNLLSCIVQLFTDNALLVMRLPSFILSIFLGGLLFLFYKKQFSFFTAITAYLFYSLSFEMNFYAVQGRGYLLLTLCVFILTIICFKYTITQKSPYIWIFILISIAGFYTIPTFLYPFVASMIFLHFYFILNKNINPLFKIYAASCAVLIGVLLLYAPVFLVSGVSSVVSNSWVKPLQLSNWIKEIPSYLGDSTNWLLNLEMGGGLLLMFIMICNIFIHTQRSARVFQLLSIVHLLSPVLLIGVQRVLPFFRIWIYLIPVISYWIGGICAGLKKSYLKLTYILALTVATLFIDLRAFKNDFEFYDKMNQTLSKIFEAIPQNVYCEEDTYYVFLNYYGIKHHVPLNVDDNFEAFVDYDFLILKPHSNFYHKGYKLFIENQYVVVYMRSN